MTRSRRQRAARALWEQRRSVACPACGAEPGAYCGRPQGRACVERAALAGAPYAPVAAGARVGAWLRLRLPSEPSPEAREWIQEHAATAAAAAWAALRAVGCPA